MFRGKWEEEAKKGCRIILAQDSTHRSDSTRVANLEALEADCVRQYKELDRKTVPKSALAWVAAAAFLLGLLATR